MIITEKQAEIILVNFGCQDDLLEDEAAICQNRNKSIMLKSLEEYDKEHMKITFEARLTGIACHRCGTEVINTDPNMVLTSYPARKKIGCTKCQWHGTCLV